MGSHAYEVPERLGVGCAPGVSRTGSLSGTTDRAPSEPVRNGEVTFMKIEIRQVEDIKATSIHQYEGAGGA
jgi:hypothetical protein